MYYCIIDRGDGKDMDLFYISQKKLNIYYKFVGILIGYIFNIKI